MASARGDIKGSRVIGEAQVARPSGGARPFVERSVRPRSFGDSPAATSRGIGCSSEDLPAKQSGGPLVAKCHDPRDADMAARVFQAVLAGRLSLDFLPVCKASQGEVLYHECVVSVIDGDGNVMPEASFRAALERLGVTRVFDELSLSLVVDELLHDASVCLAVNLSSLSAVDNRCWAAPLALLSRRPDLSSRLLIEISDTSPFARAEDLVSFATAFRDLGVRIVVEGFGLGSSPLNALIALSPDIIKIHPSLVRAVSRQRGEGDEFRRIVEIASGLAGSLVVSGVDSAGLSAAATAAGVAWQQGRFVEQFTDRPVGWRRFARDVESTSTGENSECEPKRCPKF